jgi:hypothetical protein
MPASQLDLDEFLEIGPRVPDEEKLVLSGFLGQQASIDKETGYQLNLVLTAQSPADERLPIILDITVASVRMPDSTRWADMLPIVESLRGLKNRVFANSLTAKCIELFQS